MNKKIFYNLYEKMIKYWPESIDVSDKKINSTTSATIKNLIKVHDGIGDQMEKDFLDNTDLEIRWCRQIDWSIYTLLHRAARSPECQVVYPPNLNRDDVLNYSLESRNYKLNSDNEQHDK